jgi:hypothetical protein
MLGDREGGHKAWSGLRIGVVPNRSNRCGTSIDRDDDLHFAANSDGELANRRDRGIEHGIGDGAPYLLHIRRSHPEDPRPFPSVTAAGKDPSKLKPAVDERTPEAQLNELTAA